MSADRIGRVVMIARWRPVHLGHVAVIEGLLANADRVELGIGSANRYDLRNPWTAAETAGMLRRVVGDRAHIFEVEDLGDGPRWAAMVVERLGDVDLFVTANPWVRSLLEGTWPLEHPVQFVPPQRRVRVDGTMVRRAMARGEDWRAMVPPSTAEFLDEHGLVERFRREFGLATLALDAPGAGPLR